MIIVKWIKQIERKRYAMEVVKYKTYIYLYVNE